MSGPIYERPSVPPPAPPKKPEKPSAGNKSDLPTGKKSNQVGHVIGGLKQVIPVVLADMGSGATGDGSNSDLSADLELGLQTQSGNVSGVSSVADLSWSSEPDQLHAALQPKEDIRKMTAQLKAQWWQNSPTAGGADSKMSTVEISGKFSPRSTSPIEPCHNSSQDRTLEKKTPENDTCQEKPESVDTTLEDADKAPKSMDRKSDTVDAERDGAGDFFKSPDETFEALDRKRLSTDSIGKPSTQQNDESDETGAESAVSNSVAAAPARTPPTPLPRPSLAGDHDSELVVTTECGSGTSELAPETTTASTTGTLSTPLTVSIDGRESSAQEETSPASPTTPRGPPTRAKPSRTPPARPPPFTSPAELSSEACPPLLPRRTSMDSKPAVPTDSSVDLLTSPQLDLPPKTRSLDRVRPEKPPPPLPKSLRSQVSQPADETQPDVDCRGEIAAGDDVAAHDEHTHL